MRCLLFLLLVNLLMHVDTTLFVLSSAQSSVIVTDHYFVAVDGYKFLLFFLLKFLVPGLSGIR